MANSKRTLTGRYPSNFRLLGLHHGSGLQGPGAFRSACEVAGVDVDSLFDCIHTSWTIVLLENMKPKPDPTRPVKVGIEHRDAFTSGFSTFSKTRTKFSVSKENSNAVVQFDVTELPEPRVKSVNKKTGENWHVKSDGLVSDSFPEGLRGSVMVTEQSLHAGKSTDLGRSHGFFVKVRKSHLQNSNSTSSVKLTDFDSWQFLALIRHRGACGASPRSQSGDDEASWSVNGRTSPRASSAGSVQRL